MLKFFIIICFIFLGCKKEVETNKTDYSTECINHTLNLFERYELAIRQFEVLSHTFDSFPKSKDNSLESINKLKEMMAKQAKFLGEISKLHFFSKSTDEKVSHFIKADLKYIEANKEDISKLIKKDAKNYVQKCELTYKEKENRCSKYDEFSVEYKNCEEAFNEDINLLAYEFQFFSKTEQLGEAIKEIEKLKSDMFIEAIKKSKAKYKN